MKALPRVSVLIPTFNCAVYLDEAIKSVLEQTFQDFELIIVDNDSNDGSENVVKKYLVDERVKYYRNPTNIGLVRNFNKCLEYAKGDFIKFLCADDKFAPELLAKFVAIMDEYPQVSLVTSNKEFFGLPSEQRRIPFSYLQDGRKIIYSTLQDYNWIGEPTSVMFRRSHLGVGNFNTNFTFLCDWDLWLRLLMVGDCYIFPEVLSYFRQHDNQVTAILKRQSAIRFEEFYFFKAIKEQNPYRIDLSKINIKKILKKKTLRCARLSLKLLPRLYQRKNWIIWNHSIRIAFSKAIFICIWI